MPSENQPVRLRSVQELIWLPSQPTGTIVRIDDEELVYRAVGNFSLQIAQSIGWTHQNVWMPDHVFKFLAKKRSAVFPHIPDVAAAVLAEPISVHTDRFDWDAIYVLADASQLRAKAMLVGESIPYVDAVIEFRPLPRGSLPRLFHLSPRHRNLGGIQLWP